MVTRFPMKSNGRDWFGELEVPTIGAHALLASNVANQHNAHVVDGFANGDVSM